MEQGLYVDMARISELERLISEYEKFVRNCSNASLYLETSYNGMLALYNDYPFINSRKTKSGIDPTYAILQKHALNKSAIDSVISNQKSNIVDLKNKIKQEISKFKVELEELKARGLLRVHL